jgi:pimeloyl-ACP methyl ester carboxylesterase
MSISTRQHTIVTLHGSLTVEESGQGSIPVLLIHGNSSCRGVFRHQLQGRLAENHRLIAFDLPGHGQSSNAPDPTQSYTRPGFLPRAVRDIKRPTACLTSRPSSERQPPSPAGIERLTTTPVIRRFLAELGVRRSGAVPLL